MVTLIRSRWLAGGAVLLIIWALWAQSRGTSEDKSAVRALIQGADGDNKNATKAGELPANAMLSTPQYSWFEAAMAEIELSKSR